MTEMTEERAREILGDAIQGDGSLLLHFKGFNTPAIAYHPNFHGDYIWLRRGCSLEQLKAIAFWMEKHG